MADVGVVQRSDRTGLAGEALGELGVRDLDRDIPMQPGIVRAIHLAHAALADERKNFVRAEFVAGRQPHMRIQLSLHNREANCVWRCVVE